MTSFQLPKIGNEDKFEDLVCDLFNAMERTNTFKKFGRKGHKQKGIDVFSTDRDIVIQCKKKDATRKDIIVRREILNDIVTDLDRLISEKLQIRFHTIYFLSTYNDHPDIDEFCESIAEERGLEFEIIYWGWDTIQERVITYPKILRKYFPNFIISGTRSKENRLRRDLSLKKRIKKDFAPWLDYRPKDRKQNSSMLLRAFDGKQYPFTNEADEFGQYSWFRVEIWGLYYDGMEFIWGIDGVAVYDDGSWDLEKNAKLEKNYRLVKTARVGQIRFSDIVDYDINGDEYYMYPHIFTKFRYEGLPFERTYYCTFEEDGMIEYFGYE